jgi:hypothetical protein
LQEQIKTKPGKLKGPLYVEALKESIYKNTPSYRINLAGCPNSCLLKIGKQRYRSLVDPGAKVSLIHNRVYQALQKPTTTN